MKTLIVDNEDGTFSYEIVSGIVGLHAELKQWGPQVYKRTQYVLEKFILEIKDKGFNAVYVGIPDNDPKLLKFEQLYGFYEIGRVDGNIIMKRDI